MGEESERFKRSGGRAERKGDAAGESGTWGEARPPPASPVPSARLGARTGARPASLWRSALRRRDGPGLLLGRGGQRGHPHFPPGF